MNKAILAELQKHIWAMEPRALDALFNFVLEVKPDMAELAKVEVVKTAKAVITGDTAVIAIKGVLMKNIPFLFRLFGIEATSYLDIQKQITEALADSQVKRIVLDIDSPGGIVAGVLEAAQAIADAATQKKVTAQIEDLGASAAYWLASQASKINAGANTEVGSIGVYTVYVDYSKKAENDGIQVHVIRSGEYKGVGVMGAKITNEQLQVEQEIVNGMADNFIKAVSSGRKMPAAQIRELATGRTWLAAEAKKLGLIDNVIKQKTTNSSLKGSDMTEEQEPQKKTGDENKETVNLDEIRSQANADEKERLAKLEMAFPDDTQFVLEQFKAGHSVEQAKIDYCEVLRQRNSELQQKNEELQKKGQKIGKGADIVPVGGEGSDGNSDFIEAAKQLAEEKSISMTEAMRKVRKSQPELYEAYIQQQQQQPQAA